MSRSTVLIVVVLALLAGACGPRVPAVRFDEVARARSGQGSGEGSGAGVAAGTATEGAAATAADGATNVSGGEAGGSTSAGTGGGAPGGSGGSGSLGQSGGGTSSGSDESSGGGGQSASGGGEAAAGGSSGGDGAQNAASDVGVTADMIKVGVIYSKSGPLGPTIFTPPSEGATAYFQWLNARGGVNGRGIEVVPCDDAEDPQRNVQCVDRLINQEKVFALVATSTRTYAGADDVAAAGVPDVGGEPIGDAYWTYPTFFAIRGSEYPREGEVGYKGKLYGSTLQFRWAKSAADISHVGVVFYDVAASSSFADYQIRAAEKEGLPVDGYRVNAAFPNFDTVVAQMQSDGVDAIWDTMDSTGNEKLCEAMQRKGFQPKLKMTTSQGWRRSVGDRLPDVCRSVLHAVAESRPNADTDNEAMATFRQVIRDTYGEEYDRNLAQWTLEGWTAAKLFTDGVESMGANVTRKGLVTWLNDLDGYDADGLLIPLSWKAIDFDSSPNNEACAVFARWNDERRNFVAASDVPHCETTPWLAYEPAG